LPCHVWVAHHGSRIPPQSLRTGVWKSPSLLVAAAQELPDTPVQGTLERLGRPPESSPQIDRPEPIERLPGRPSQAAPGREARAAVAGASHTKGGALLCFDSPAVSVPRASRLPVPQHVDIAHAHAPCPEHQVAWPSSFS